MEPPRRVEQDRVVAVQLRIFDRLAADVHRVLVGAGVEARDIELPRQDLELLDGGRPVDVGGDQVRRPLLFLQVQGDLAARGGLPRPLQPHEHHGDGRPAGEVQVLRLRPHHLRHLVVDDLDEVLVRGQRREHLGAQRLGPDSGDEILHHLVVDVGFQEGEADLVQGPLDVPFRDAPVAAQILQDALELFRQVLEQEPTPLVLRERTSKYMGFRPETSREARVAQPAAPAALRREWNGKAPGESPGGLRLPELEVSLRA